MPGKRSMAEAGGRAPRRRVAPGLTTDRRSRHNAVERKRQQQLSSYISELGEFLEVCCMHLSGGRSGARAMHAYARGILLILPAPRGCVRLRSTVSRCVGTRSAS